MSDQEKGRKRMLRQEWRIYDRAVELAARQQQGETLGFYQLATPDLKVMVIACDGVEIARVGFDQMPEGHRQLPDKWDGLADILIADETINLTTANLEKNLGVALWVPDPETPCAFRQGGGGLNSRYFDLQPGEILFVVANKNSLTIKQGRLSDLRTVGVKIPKGWRNRVIQ